MKAAARLTALQLSTLLDVSRNTQQPVPTATVNSLLALGLIRLEAHKRSCGCGWPYTAKIARLTPAGRRHVRAALALPHGSERA